MNAMWIIYFADVSQGLGIATFILSILIAGMAGAMWINAFTTDEYKKLSEYRKRYFPIAAALMFFSILIPCKQTIYMMAAAKVGQDIVTAPETKEIGGKVLKLINEKLDEQLEKKDKSK